MYEAMRNALGITNLSQTSQDDKVSDASAPQPGVSKLDGPSLFELGKRALEQRDEKGAKEAFNFFTQAAQLTHLPSIYAVGHCLVNGIGTDPNPEKGTEFLKIAAAKGLRLPKL